MIFIVQGFRTIIFIFIAYNFTADMSFGLFQVFVELRSLQGTSNHVLYLIHGSRLSWFR